jgi:oligopeptide transport system ATP-binding protein
MMNSMENILEIKNLVKRFPVHGGLLGRTVGHVHAVNDVSLSIRQGETLGVVGESGSGKSTMGMLILRLIDPDGGQIIFEGKDLTSLNQKQLRPLRSQMQVIFQDPYASLNPRMMVGEIVEEPLLVHNMGNKTERKDRVDELLRLVGLPRDARGKYPHEFSGGQRQRIGIARAIALNPKLIIADEPVSALDVSIRGEIINLLNDIQQKFGLTYLFIAHDLTIVVHTSTRIAVMYLGKIMELLPSDKIGEALHPYTQALMSAIPIPDPASQKKRIMLKGDVPSPLHLPSGCVFHPRCRFAQERCRQEIPVFEKYTDDCYGACHFIREMVPVK